MTKKQTQILEAALQLFSEEGYHGTSTSKVAQVAGVSEGLIFRHFRNKEGLLNAVIIQGEHELNRSLYPILAEEDPKAVIKQTLEIPFMIESTNYKYWKFRHKMNLGYRNGIRSNKMTLEQVLVAAFEKLRYKNPKMEMEFLLHLLNGLALSRINGSKENTEETKAFLMRKYHLD